MSQQLGSVLCVDVIKGNNQAALLGYRRDANPNIDTRISLAGFVMRNAALRNADSGSKLGLLHAELFSDCGYVVHGRYISAAHEKKQKKSADLKAHEVRASCASATPLQNARMNDNDKKKAKVTEENREESRRLKAIYDARKAEGKLPQSQAAVGHDLKIGTQAMVSHCLHGRTAMTLPTAVAFARLLGCEVSDFSPRLAQQQQALSAPPVVVEQEAPSTSSEIAASLRRTVAAIAREYGVNPADLTDPSDEALERVQRAIEQAQEKKPAGTRLTKTVDTSRPSVFRTDKASRGKGEQQP